MLDKIKNRAVLLSMSTEEEQLLCEEIRQFLIQNVARTGGHLASNLGVVELTVALHKVYDTSVDRLLFDVGHQAYVHKILTGRSDLFDTLRTFGGLAGFPKPSESDHDAFIAGHASDAVSVALGMARARSLQEKDYNIVAVLGDGALTGGLAYEGLNDAGESGEPIVVVLNDNGMSITPNVGGVAKHLSLLRLKPGYFEIKKFYREFTAKTPCGRKLYDLSHRFKTFLRRKWLGVTIFEEMGFYYLGPVDGHDVNKLTFLLHEAKEMRKPVLLHVITQKGKGYQPAENMPASYHGVGKFDPEVGLELNRTSHSFSETFGQALLQAAASDRKICAITAAMEQGTGLQQFAASFPNRFFDVGIAEGHAVCMAAGLAKQGMLPVFAVYSTFFQRSFDMLQHDVALLNLHVVFAVDRAGFVGEDGETHHGVFDVGYLRQVPGMQVLCPASQAELITMLHRGLYDLTGPVAVRYPKGKDGTYRAGIWKNILHDDACITLVCYGTTVNDLISVSELLIKENIICDIIKLDQIAPLNISDVFTSVQKTKHILVVEETAQVGCVGQEILSTLFECGVPVNAKLLNLGSGIYPHGSLSELRALAGIDVDGIYLAAKELYANET